MGFVVDPADPCGWRLAECLAAQGHTPEQARALLAAFRMGVVTAAVDVDQALAAIAAADVNLLATVVTARAGGMEVVAVAGGGGYSVFPAQRFGGSSPPPPVPAKRPRRRAWTFVALLLFLVLLAAGLGGWWWRQGWASGDAQAAHASYRAARLMEGRCAQCVELCKLLDLPARSRENVAARVEDAGRQHRAEADRLSAEWRLRWRYLGLKAD